jgi:hypothetical protein
LRRVNVLFKRRDLRIGGDDFNRRKRAFADQSLIAFELESRLFDGINLDLQISQRKSQIPVALLDLRDDFDRALANCASVKPDFFWQSQCCGDYCQNADRAIEVV